MVQLQQLIHLQLILNDPIINLGVTTSTRTVMMTALAGVSTIKLDTTAGINTGDGIAGTNIAFRYYNFNL